MTQGNQAQPGNEDQETQDCAALHQIMDLCFGPPGPLTWKEEGEDRRLVARSRLSLAGQLAALDAWGGLALPEWDGVSIEQPSGGSLESAQLRVKLSLPRWQMMRALDASSLGYRASPACAGSVLTLVAAASGLRAALHPLMPPLEREALHEMQAGLGWGDALRRERENGPLDAEGRSLAPVPLDHAPQAQLGGALVLLRSLDGQTRTLLTPCGEALRRSVAETAGEIGRPEVLTEETPQRWTHRAPRPRLEIKLDTARGIEALPWRRHWGANDAVLARHGWRGTWENDWDGRAAQDDGLGVQAQVEGTEIKLSFGDAGRTFFGTLRWRPGNTLV